MRKFSLVLLGPHALFLGPTNGPTNGKGALRLPCSEQLRGPLEGIADAQRDDISLVGPFVGVEQ